MIYIMNIALDKLPKICYNNRQEKKKGGVKMVNGRPIPVPVGEMTSLIQQRRDLVVKVGQTYEVSRPLALELWKMLVDEVVRHGGSIKESVKVEYASPEMVIVSVNVAIKLGESEVVLCEIGEAYKHEKGKEDTMARTAYTRAMKRALERIAGEDFINRVILSMFGSQVKEVPATDKQKELIKRLVDEKRITKEVIDSLKQEGQLPESFVLNDAIKDNTLTYSQARVILDRVFKGGKQ